MTIEQDYKTFQKGPKTVYFERSRYSAYFRNKDVPYPFS